MQLWIGTASALPYTDGVGRCVVGTLLAMASDRELSPHIPAVAWDWLNKRPVLRPGCWGLDVGTSTNVVQIVRELGDVRLIVSYLLVVWSEFGDFEPIDGSAIRCLIREELGGIEAAGYRADLIRRLDYVLSQLDRGLDNIWRPHNLFVTERSSLRMKQQYEGFRTELLEADVKAKT